MLIYFWPKPSVFPALQMKLHICTDDDVFLGPDTQVPFGIWYQKPVRSISDCCMESICCSTEIPAVTVCPERDYRIFLNWTSIHLSIKTISKSQERNGSIKCTWGIYNTPQNCYNQPLKSLLFEISLFQLFLASIYHTVSDFFWLLLRGNSDMLNAVIHSWISTRSLVTSQAPVTIVTSSGEEDIGSWNVRGTRSF